MTKRELTPEEREKLQAGTEEMFEHLASAAKMFAHGLKAFGEAFTEVAREVKIRADAEKAEKAPVDDSVAIYVVGPPSGRIGAFTDHLRKGLPDAWVKRAQSAAALEGAVYTSRDRVLLVDSSLWTLEEREAVDTEIAKSCLKTVGNIMPSDVVRHVYGTPDLDRIIDEVSS